MIDTIVLTVPPEHFSILDHNRFNPSTLGFYQPPYYRLGARGNFKCTQNPTVEELKKGIYKPRLTVIKRLQAGALVVVLKIEFSVPKLLFGNNFDEVEEGHFEEIIKRLYEVIYSMGVLVAPQILRDAPVSAVHYSKNIILTDYSTPSLILNELAKIDLNLKLDLNQTDYRNEGHSLKFHANSYEITFYDKKKDLQQAKTSDKRAIERDNALQLDLFEEVQVKSPFEVLRMEIRLNQRLKMKQIFDFIGKGNDLTFKSVFKKDIAQKVLIHYLTQIENSYALLEYLPKSSQEFIADFKIMNPKVKVRKMLQIYALKTLIDEMGIRQFREAIKIFGKHNWDRLKNDLSIYKFPEGSFAPFKTMGQILNDFEPVKLKDHSENIY